MDNPTDGQRYVNEDTSPVPDDLQMYLREIVERLSSAHAAVMVGAGFSRNAVPNGATRSSFPDWPDLGDLFFEKIHGRKPGVQSKYQFVPRLADAVQAALNRPALNQLIQDAIPDKDHDPSNLHKKLLSLPWTDVFTTNYDTLLERSSDEITSKRYDIVANMSDLVYSKQPRIVKLHGTLRSNPPYIITEEDYRRYPIDYAPFVNTVRQALIENALCLIGFSGDDPNFVQWTGWIHDNMDKHSSPRIYLIEVFPVSEAHRRLLERRNITLVDLSKYGGLARDPYTAIQWFLDYLLAKTKDSPLEWPKPDNDLLQPKPNMNDADRQTALTKLARSWRHDRLRFPGWVVVPDDRRTVLWRYTYRWMPFVCSGRTGSDVDHLQLVSELLWRMERCLCPLSSEQAEFLEALLSRDLSVMDPDGSTPRTGHPVAAEVRAPDDVRFMRHSVLLALLRYYREDGMLQEWRRTYLRLEKELSHLAPEHRADLNYQSVLYSIFALDVPDTREKLARWRVDDNLPFWSVKRAGLLAEIGELSQAIRIVDQSLRRVRGKLNLKPIMADYSLISQESYAMVLLRYMHNSKAFFSLSVKNDTDGEEDSETSRELTERWNILKLYKCDPWSELNAFEVSLERHYSKATKSNIKRTFDIDVVTTTIGFQLIDADTKEALRAYSFLRFCEDAGIPFRIPASTFGKTAVEGAVARISEQSPYWAMASIVRLGDDKDVDLLINRLSLARMSVTAVDAMVELYLRSVRQSARDIQSGDPFSRSNFGMVLGAIVPEILSRLSVKSSVATRNAILDFTLELYRSESRLSYRGVRILMKRLIRSFAIDEYVGLIHKLLEFPVIEAQRSLVEREFVNPFAVVWEASLAEIRDYVSGTDATMVGDDHVDRLIADALSASVRRRSSAVFALSVLHLVGLLIPDDANRFAEALWNRTDEFGLPRDTGFDYRSVFLVLPGPADRTEAERFRNYVENTPFPVQGGRGPISVTGEVPLCVDIIEGSRYVKWTQVEVCKLIDRAAAWWDADKSRLRSGDQPGPFGSVTDIFEERLQQLVGALAAVLIPGVALSGEDIRRDTLRRVVAEFREHGLWVDQLVASSLYVFPEWRENVFGNINAHLGSEIEKCLVDSLNALLVIIEREGRSSEAEEALSIVGQAIRWRRDTVVRHYLDVVADLTTTHLWTIPVIGEDRILVGLKKIAEYTKPEDGGIEYLDKLPIRKSAAKLACRLHGYFAQVERSIPEEIDVWDRICRSSDEFAEVAHQWIRRK